jgi:hypothetical protein
LLWGIDGRVYLGFHAITRPAPARRFGALWQKRESEDGEGYLVHQTQFEKNQEQIRIDENGFRQTSRK